LGNGLWLGVLLNLVSLVPPLLAKAFFDSVWPARDAALLPFLVIAGAVLSILIAILSALRSYYEHTLFARADTELNLVMFNHLLHLPMSLLEGRTAGDLHSRSGDLQQSVSQLLGAMTTVVLSGVYLVTIPTILLLLNWRLAILSMVTVPVSTAATLFIGRRSRAIAFEQSQRSAAAMAFQLEVLSNVRLGKVLSAERTLLGRAARLRLDARDAHLRGRALSGLLTIVNVSIAAVGSALFLWVSWSMILEDRLSIGAFMAFSSYLALLVGPLNQSLQLVELLQRSSASLQRAFEFLDATPEQDPGIVRTAPRPVETRLGGGIELRRVMFGYPGTADVLRDVSMVIAPRQLSAVVGHSGAGKSSLIKLLARLYEPTGGSILYDGIPSRAISLSDVRRQVAVVWQENGILRGTFRDNLTLGYEAARDTQIEEALEAAMLGDFVASLPRGLDTEINEAGSSLSAGQRQRLALARAFLRPAPILLLDEATSHLDVETESAVLASLKRISMTRTVVLVTHRLQAARVADAVFVADRGSISGGQPHDLLLRSSATYRALVAADARAGEVHARDESKPRRLGG
jgi:ABC-type bacteriocin/lantibiotic exporter with double-glycine peptidase domain